MNIQIKIKDYIKSNYMDCFTATPYVEKEIQYKNTISGVVIINDEEVEFTFSPYTMDGHIKTDNEKLAVLVRALIPVYVFGL